MKEQIKLLVENYIKNNPRKMDSIPVSGKVFDSAELENIIEAALEGWWTEGRWTLIFEERLKKFLGIRFVHSCNSGSSANLIAIAALCSPRLEDKRILKGSEIITVAAAFPTTINPIIQNECIPVFVDVETETYNVDIMQLEKAISNKTRAVILAHTLGNPFNLKVVKDFCAKYNLWLIEDNCDALGSKYAGEYTGTFGDIATLSFYPAHHITTAEGGAVITNNDKLSKIICSVRDWGRHCWCSTGKDDSCGKRFEWELGQLPKGYDHKYIYGELGYNLKISDLHSAIGVAQMDKLAGFIQKRKDNYKYLYEKIKQFEDYFILPKATKNSEPSWFGFLLSVKEGCLDREDLMRYLAINKIGTRLLFGGNMIKQPYFTDNKDISYRVIGDLKNTDYIMNNTFWLGVYPGITTKMINEVIRIIGEYLKK